MADEVALTFTLPGNADANHAAWRAQPPAFLVDGEYRLKDESYDTLVYEANVTSAATRILMFGMAKTLYTLAVTFRDRDDGDTRVTITGKALPKVQDALARYR
jgi:hypothetical protein